MDTRKSVDNTGGKLQTSCLNWLNPAGGFESQHNALCHYSPTCDENAEVHIAVPGSNDAIMWCGNVCGKCANKITASHRTAIRSEVKHA